MAREADEHKRWSTAVIVLFLAGNATGMFWVRFITAIFAATGWSLDPWLLSWEPRGVVLVITWVGAIWFYRDSLIAAVRGRWWTGSHITLLELEEAKKEQRPEDAREIARLKTQLAEIRLGTPQEMEIVAQPTYTATRLSLRLGNTKEETIAIDSANIWKWQILTLTVPIDLNGKPMTVEGHSLFVVFDKPLGTPLKLTSKFTRPVKLIVQDLNSRSLLMNVEGDLFNNTAEFVVEQGEVWSPRELQNRMIGIALHGDGGIVRNNTVTIRGSGEILGVDVSGKNTIAIGNSVTLDRRMPSPHSAPERK